MEEALRKEIQRTKPLNISEILLQEENVEVAEEKLQQP
jgi:hypothetical protein